MALAYSNITVELREISLKDRPSELFKASGKGTVPILVIDENNIIDESLDIMLWSLRNSEIQLSVSEYSNEEMRLIENNDKIFKKWLDKYKYHDRYPEHSKEYYRSKCDKILSGYEKKLNNKNYLIENHINAVDIAIFPFVRQFANVDYNWFNVQYTHLVNWLERIVSSDLFKRVMMKYKIWNDGPTPIITNFKD